MFRVKICGITSVDDAQMARDLGAGAIGLNFYSKSKRFISVELASDIRQKVGGDLTLVGVFVNSSTAFIRKTYNDVGLHAVQIHGDETIEDLLDLKPMPVIKACRISERDHNIPAETLAAASSYGLEFEAILIDAAHARQYGGTGLRAPIETVTKIVGASRARVILAGGLTPENVKSAIMESGVAAVDVASGVEKSPGRKRQDLMRRFINNANSAFREISHRSS